MGKVLFMRKGETHTAPSAGIRLGDIAEGSIVKINEGGSPVEFYVAKHDYESVLNGTGRTLLARKNCYDTRAWHSSNVNAYASSAIDSWLNNTYKNKFDDYVKTAMGTTKFYYTPGNGNPYVSSLSRSVFLLSVYELTGGDYGSVNQEGAVLPIYSILQDVGQWTRSPNTGRTTSAEIVSSGSSVIAHACSTTAPFRPCFTIPSNSLFDEKTMIFKKGASHTAPGDHPCNIIVSVTDTAGYLSTLINQRGILSVDGNTITGENTDLTTQSSKVAIIYTMTGSISSPRTVTVNGVVIGTAGNAGDSLSTTIDVSEGDTITIKFSM